MTSASFLNELQVLRKLDLTTFIVNRAAVDLKRNNGKTSFFFHIPRTEKYVR